MILIKMDSLEVYEALQTLPVKTMVYAANRLPNAISVPCGIVVNTDPDTKPGQHWVAIWIDAYREAEYSDSYGVPPFFRSHKTFLKLNSRKLTHNTMEMQSLNSTVCGQYCLLFLHFRANGHTMAEFQSMFSDNTIANDRILVKKYNQCFRRGKSSKPATHGKIQVCCCKKVPLAYNG